MKTEIKKMLRENLENKVLYCAVVLDNDSHNELLNIGIPEGWKPFAHHMTIAFGKSLEDLGLSVDDGKLVILTVTHIGVSDMAIAAKVDGYQSTNKIPHITIGINVNEGGKPVMSNEIKDWKAIEPFDITGVVKNILKK